MIKQMRPHLSQAHSKSRTRSGFGIFCTIVLATSNLPGQDKTSSPIGRWMCDGVVVSTRTLSPGSQQNHAISNQVLDLRSDGTLTYLGADLWAWGNPINTWLWSGDPMQLRFIDNQNSLGWTGSGVAKNDGGVLQVRFAMDYPATVSSSFGLTYYHDLEEATLSCHRNNSDGGNGRSVAAPASTPKNKGTDNATVTLADPFGKNASAKPTLSDPFSKSAKTAGDPKITDPFATSDDQKASGPGDKSPTDQRPMVLRDACVTVKQKLESELRWYTFTNACFETIVIKEYIKQADGHWEGGEDCRAPGKWILATSQPYLSQYVVHAQVVKSCAEELFLKWPDPPKY